MACKSTRYGQNFLTDIQYAQRIVSALPQLNKPVVEVGPGKGILTKLLLDRHYSPEQIWAIELDMQLLQALQAKWPTLHWRQGDILKLSLNDLAIPDDFLLLSNLPYEISHPFFDRLILWTDRILAAVIMVQKEFADKICLKRDGAAQGHMLAGLYLIEPLFNVPPGAFRPCPKVTSSVIRLQPRPDRIPEPHRAGYYAFLKLCFSSPRKTVHNNLKETWHEAVTTSLNRCRIPLNARAEELSSTELLNLWHSLQPAGPDGGQTD